MDRVAGMTTAEGAEMFRQDHTPDLRVHVQDRLQVVPGKDAATKLLGQLGRLVLVAVIAGAVILGGRLAVDDPSLAAAADTAEAATPTQDLAARHAAELAALRAEVDLLTEQAVALRSELALLTGQGGVLSQMIAHLQDQRRVNATHETALRQLFSATGAIGAALPVEQQAAPQDLGGRPVQVTPVARAQGDAPQRVVLIPQEAVDDGGDE